MNETDKVQTAQNTDLDRAVAQLACVEPCKFSLPFLWQLYGDACEKLLPSLPEDQRAQVETMLVLCACIHKAETNTLTSFDAQMLTEAVQHVSFIVEV